MAISKETWVISDGFISENSNGLYPSHEAVCVLNRGEEDANIHISVYFEDREPMDKFYAVCKARRTNHIRLDRIKDSNGSGIPVGVPYALVVESDMSVIVQHTRLDTTQAEMALMTTMAYKL